MNPPFRRRRGGWLAALLPVAASLPGCGEPAGETAPGAYPNILFINLEDCSAASLGCYGNTVVKTPNLDAFARTALRFDRAYVQFPACHPSRYSYLTGLRPETTGVVGNELYTDAVQSARIESWPARLGAAGYRRASVGKLFHYTRDQLRDFDTASVLDQSDPRIAPYRAQRLPSDWFGPSEIAETHHPDYVIGADAAAALHTLAAAGRPFLLAVGMARPHTPLDPPARTWRMYEDTEIPLPPGWDRTHARFNPDLFTARWPSRAEVIDAIRAYYACLTFVDEQVGRILQALDDTGLADRTAVIVVADHGFHLGAQGRWSKYTPFEGATRVPLLIRLPGTAHAGEVCDAVVELIDLAPTICELTGAAQAPAFEGDSLAPLLDDPRRPWKRAAFTLAGWQGQRSQWVRTERFRYSEWTGRQGRIQRWLFDLEADPTEATNLANDPAHAATVAEHAAILAAGWQSSRPPAR